MILLSLRSYMITRNAQQAAILPLPTMLLIFVVSDATSMSMSCVPNYHLRLVMKVILVIHKVFLSSPTSPNKKKIKFSEQCANTYISGAPAGGEIKVREIEHCVLHQHPLTLCEINGEGELFCPRCGDPFLDQSYNCKRCQFCPQRCSVCMTTPSGSFYICKLCWPKSPLFHKSCIEFTKDIQISFHPHSSLYVEGECSPSDRLSRCHFCKQKPLHYKFCCDKCAFQIHFGCALKLIKYHKGREHIQHFSHSQPSTLLDLGNVNCRICKKSIQGPSLSCVPCEFYIHQSCCELKQEIDHLFDPLQKLTLSNMHGPYRFDSSCNACGFQINGFRYHCEYFKIFLHPECAISSKPTIKYEGHEHLLTLMENGK